MSQSNPEDPVKRQLDAYNAKDIELFDDHGGCRESDLVIVASTCFFVGG